MRRVPKFLIMLSLFSLIFLSSISFAGRLPNPNNFFTPSQHNVIIGGGSFTYQQAVENALQNSGFKMIFSLILKIGWAVALIVVVIYGINWLLATPAKKAELKEAAKPILIAVFILAAGSGPAIKIVETIVLAFETGGPETVLISGTQAVYSIVRTFGIALAVLIIGVMAIEWIFATPAKKAELKAKLGFVVVGLGIIIGALTILTLVESFFS